MTSYLLSGLLLLLGIFPLSFVRKNIITSDEFFGIFIGNYIYYSIFFFIAVLLLYPVRLVFKKLTSTQINLSIICFLVLVGSLGYYNYRIPTPVFQSITIKKMAQVEKMRIAFISDLHLNSNSNSGLFADAVTAINAAKVDLILVGGDLLQDSYAQVKDDYATIFKPLKSTFGAYAIMGNHEYYADNAEENIAYVESLGFRVVRDELIDLVGIQIIARDDKYNDTRLSLARLYKKFEIDETKPVIVLDHNPKSIFESRQLNADLQLSGHTHAGQFFPLNIVLDFFYENARGYKRFDSLHTIVSEGLGVGYWRKVGPWQMPYRLGTKSQINIIDLAFLPKRANDTEK